MGIERELSYRMFHQREEQLEHVGYEEEARLYFAVATGDISLVKEYAQNYMKPDATGNEKNGMLSKDPLQNEYGMIREEAYTISDLYINKMDVCNNSQKILYLQGEMLLDFTTRMAALEKKANYPIPIAQAIDYINNHLQEPLTLNKIASILGLTPSYLSYLFKKETGTTIKKYILERKLKAAETMLLYSDMSSSDIAEYFNFASQSYFISCFKKATGQTPLEYRQHHYQIYTKPVHNSSENL